MRFIHGRRRHPRGSVLIIRIFKVRAGKGKNQHAFCFSRQSITRKTSNTDLMSTDVGLSALSQLYGEICLADHVLCTKKIAKQPHLFRQLSETLGPQSPEALILKFLRLSREMQSGRTFYFDRSYWIHEIAVTRRV